MITTFPDVTPAILTVGGGRGFIVAHERRIDVDGDHCAGIAMSSPPRTASRACRFFTAKPAGPTGIETYQNLLAPLGGKPAVWVECVFADPVGDIAVLGQPDSQELGEQAEAYDELVESVTPLKIAVPGTEGWMLSLDGVWFRCEVQTDGGPRIALAKLEGEFLGGRSFRPR
jgi:hypothetical protein